jgi:hypothetical protein
VTDFNAFFSGTRPDNYALPRDLNIHLKPAQSGQVCAVSDKKGGTAAGGKLNYEEYQYEDSDSCGPAGGH